MDKEKLIKKACYLVDLIENVLAAVESCKPAESLPLYHYKPEEYTPAEDTLAMIKKAFGKSRFLEIAFNAMEQYYKIRKIMLDTSFEKYGRGKDWFQHNNYNLIIYDFPDTFVSLYSIAKAELHTSEAK